MDPVGSLILWTIRLRGSTTLGYVDSYLFSEKISSVGFGEIRDAAERLKESGLIVPRQGPFCIPLSTSFVPFIFTAKGRAAARELPDDPRGILEEIRALPESKVRY